MTPENEDGYLAGAFDFCGSVECRIDRRNQTTRKCRLSFTHSDIARLKFVQRIVDAGGTIYKKTDGRTWQLEYYKQSVIRDFFNRVRPMLSESSLKRFINFESNLKS